MKIYYLSRGIGIKMLQKSQKGEIAEAKALVYFVQKGYEALMPLNQHLNYDLVVTKDGVFTKVQVKFTSELKKGKPRFRCENFHTKYSDVDIFFIVTPFREYVLTLNDFEQKLGGHVVANVED